MNLHLKIYINQKLVALTILSLMKGWKFIALLDYVLRQVFRFRIYNIIIIRGFIYKVNEKMKI